jgi:hypothetical protein
MESLLRSLTPLVLLAAAHAVGAAEPPSPVSGAGVAFFEQRIRPLLAANCYSCHGPQRQRSGLRLDSLDGMRKGGDRGPALVPGAPDQSLFLQAVRHLGELRMPPKGKLTEVQVADLIAWVKMGAPAPAGPGHTAARADAPFDLAARRRHWSYQPVRPPALPPVHNAAWCASPIDRFILARLEAAGLAPAPPAERRALVRRVTFDLTGLPPTPAEVEAFVNDRSPDAFAKVVDRLLASPHYGERWARHWLDLVRYSETLGFEFDYDLWSAWRYRDSVIRAFNADLPYDRFVVEHLAGDLLPEPRRHPTDGSNESIVATGFFWMGEGKQTPVDIRQEQADVIDNQIDVLGKAFLGQTIACARCHDHKFDAISTRDYYGLVGYLKSSRYQQAFLDAPERIQAKVERLAALRATLRERVASDLAGAWLGRAAQSGHYLLAARPLLTAVPAGRASTEETARAFGVDAARLERWVAALRHKDLDDSRHPLYAWRRLADTSELRQPLGQRRAALRAALDASAAQAARATAAVVPFEDFHRPTYEGWYVTGDAFGAGPARAGDIVLGDGPGRPVGRFVAGGAHSGLLSPRLQGELRSRTFTIERRYVHYRLAGRASRLNLVIAGNTLIMNPMYGKLTLTPAGDRLAWRTMPVDRWIGQRAYIEVSDSTVPMHRLNPPPSTARTPEGPGDGYILLDRVVFSDGADPPCEAPNQLNVRALDRTAGDDLEALAAAYQDLMVQALQRWRSGATPAVPEGEDEVALLNWLLENELLDDGARTGERPDSSGNPAALAGLLAEYRRLEAALPAPQRAPALADGTGENESVYLRGNYKTPGARVPRRPPEALADPEPPVDGPGSGRLALARRLANPSNPLLARVLVNRLWQHHFGEGLVRTPDDFGRMGQPPTHPELLDYLATELVRSGWSVKAPHRLLLLSSSYQMSSRPDEAGTRLDPENRLLHRMPVRRLEAEAIRDAILAVSGRLDRTLYGPSVLPYLTPHMEGRGRPSPGPLDGAGRRSIYLNARRNFLTPMLVTFDYPVSFGTLGRRGVTASPAQALTLMNDPFVVEEAARWARRVRTEPGLTDEQRVEALYRTALGRPPTAAERRGALLFVARQAGGLAEGPAEVQAWADLCHVLINVKEFIFLE